MAKTFDDRYVKREEFDRMKAKATPALDRDVEYISFGLIGGVVIITLAVFAAVGLH